MALTPLALGMGEGGEAQAPMARAVIGGLLSSMLITLILVPVVYSIFEWKNGKSSGGEVPNREELELGVNNTLRKSS